MQKIWIVVFVACLLILTLALDRIISWKKEEKKSAEEQENRKSSEDGEKPPF